MTGTTQNEAFDAVDIIRVKRDRGTLTPAQIDWTIDAYTRGVIADEQMAALNMAILLNGMDRAEIARWTAAMIASGERMDFSSLRRPDGGVKATTDKHSTGGVGDKITLPLAPLCPLPCNRATPGRGAAGSLTAARSGRGARFQRYAALRAPQVAGCAGDAVQVLTAPGVGAHAFPEGVSVPV